jgi:hypothetical protein
MCVLFSLQLLSETFLILRRIQRDVIRNVCCPSCKAPVILVRCGVVSAHRIIVLVLFSWRVNLKFCIAKFYNSRVKHLNIFIRD